MGGQYFKNLQTALPCFRAVEVTASLKVDCKRTVPFRHVILLHNDKETLDFVECNMSRFARNLIMSKELAVMPEPKMSTYLPNEIEPFLESIVLNPNKNILQDLTASLKKATLSLAMLRFRGDKEMICNVLGLSGSQLEEELRLVGLCQLAIKGSP